MSCRDSLAGFQSLLEWPQVYDIRLNCPPCSTTVWPAHPTKASRSTPDELHSKRSRSNVFRLKVDPRAESRRVLSAAAEMQIGAVSGKHNLNHKMSLHIQFKRDLWEINFRKVLTYINVLQVPGKTFLWKYAVWRTYKSVPSFMVPYTES